MVAPQEIDRVYKGQPTRIRFSAFNQRTTPEINGTVQQISADATTDSETGADHFLVRIALNDGERDRLGSSLIVPGMPAEVYIQTQPRQVLSYLLKPITDQLEKAFREE